MCHSAEQLPLKSELGHVEAPQTGEGLAQVTVGLRRLGVSGLRPDRLRWSGGIGGLQCRRRQVDSPGGIIGFVEWWRADPEKKKKKLYGKWQK